MSVKSRCTRTALQSSIEHQRSVTYLRPVCLQPDPQDGSFDYFACGGSGHWAEYSSEPSSDGIEVRGTSRKLLHAYGESPSAPDAAIGAANNPAAQSDHHTANNGTNGSHAAASHANHATGISTSRPNTQRTSHPHVAGHPQDAATGQPSTSYDANNAADSGHTATGNHAKRPGGVHPGQFSYTHPKAAGRFGTAGNAGPANAAQQCAQHSTTRRADHGKGTCAEHGIGPYTARQRHIHNSDLNRSHTQRHEGRDRRAVCRLRIAAGAAHGHSIDAIADAEATAETADPAATERAEPIGADPGPLGPDPQAGPAVTKRFPAQQIPTWQDASTGPHLTEEWVTKWSYRAPPPQHTGPSAGFSQSSQPPLETGAPSVSYMDLTQEAATAPQQPPSRFRPSNYTVDLSNATNPPPPQVMVKPAVMMRRVERPPPVSLQ